MLIKPASDIRSSEITDKKLYLNRREFIRAGAITGATAAAAASGILGAGALLEAKGAPHGRKVPNIKKGFALNATDKLNAWEDITSYNNYYEFGIDKSDPAEYAKNFKTEPWKVTVEGECAKKGVMDLEDVLKGETLEERVYRHRCVEAWSMIIPWVGFPLANFITRCEPTSKAKYVEFYTLYDPKQMPGTRSPVLRWPYVEGLRMDEAMHPLTILVAGLYDEVLPNQDGAPLRLAVPWKYGFKHIKSIVKVRFVEKQPLNSWQLQAPDEYGFYANVNPGVDHPRWSQSTERRIGEFLRRRTLMFNGYGDQVASLYTGLDLRRNY
ncbi:MAG TPA: protein-methionine-sulfoxide reductase catalytic subunit MsrP [Vicinamibacterales bacterium]|jgi:sulfoxide reductase catalytic subunit YedY|nr:protein-methionine-sulfoxide reductase catalytic subunit MsrP [Vicinamibacterales bacterium]